ncbi:hypothetical protein H1Q59_07000 [Holosporaceae bacterium 'Namur']|nr:hypothetical protein [Holosporaceae bacterium 'Namur']
MKTFDYSSEGRQQTYPLHYWIRKQGSEYVERIYDLMKNEITDKHEFFNREDEQGNTPMHIFAAFNGDKPNTIVNAEYMLTQGSSLNALNNEGNTPLHEWANMYKYLIDSTMNIEVKPFSNMPYSTLKASMPFLGWMVMNGAKLDIENNKHTTALDLITQFAPKDVRVDEKLMKEAYNYWRETGKTKELKEKNTNEKGCCIMM